MPTRSGARWRRAALAVLAATSVLRGPQPAAAQAFAEWAGPPSPIQPIGDPKLRGELALRPNGIGEYELWASVTLPRHLAAPQPGGFPLIWALTPGSCAEWPMILARGDAEDLLRLTPPVYDNWQVFRLVVPGDWFDRPLVLRAEHTGDPPVYACADLPIGEARAREPLPGARAALAELQPAPGQHARGRLLVWATASGDQLMRLEVEALGGASTAAWILVEGSCAASRGSGDPDATSGIPGRVLARGPLPVDDNGQGSFSLVVPRAWAGQPLSLLVPLGTNLMLVCADVPPPPTAAD